MFDHDANQKPAYWAYTLLARVVSGERIAVLGHEDGRLDGGMVAFLASRDGSKTRVLVVNRSAARRTVAAGAAIRVTVFDDPRSPPHIVAPGPGGANTVTVPPRSLVLIER